MKHWLWKYQIFFDSNLLPQLESFCRQLTLAEQTLFRQQVAFYSSFYTFEILLEALNNPLLNKSEVLLKAIAEKEKCSQTHHSLISAFQAEIEKYPEREILNTILEHSAKTTYRVNFLTYLQENIADIQTIIDNITSIAKRKIRPETKLTLSSKNLIDNYHRCLNQITNSCELADKYGQFTLQGYQIKIINDNGFGEWWNKDIYEEYDQDTLILYANQNSLNHFDFLYTIIHEVYPGHGHFFELTTKTNKTIDTGAFLLIEGYATYCEIRSLPCRYAANLEIKYAKLILDCLALNYDKLPKQTIRTINQKIGYLESYYFGAFLIDYLIQEKFKTPKNFLEYLNEVNKGDFFKLFQTS